MLTCAPFQAAKLPCPALGTWTDAFATLLYRSFQAAKPPSLSLELETDSFATRLCHVPKPLALSLELGTDSFATLLYRVLPGCYPSLPCPWT